MKTKSFFLALTAFLAVGLSSCKNGQISLPPCTGRPGEVLIVMADDLYKSSAGDSLIAAFTQEEPALPQTGMEGAEAMFNVLHLPPAGLTNTIRPARNLMIVQVGPKFPMAEVKVYKDYWAQDQLLIFLNAPDADQLKTLINENTTNLVETLRNEEVNRQMAYNLKYRNEDLYQKILREKDIEASFPKGYEVLVDTGNFMWIQYAPPDITLGVLIWTYPYTSEKQLEPKELQSFDDAFLKTRVPGPSGPGKESYMSIVPNMDVVTRSFQMNGNFVRETRGLWEVKIDFMGGPFIAWTFVDEKRNRLVTAFGFVYAPKIDKRDQVRKLESILKTIDFPDQVK